MSFNDQERLSALHGWRLYVVEEDGGAFSKIGTAAVVQYRVDSLRNGNPRRLVVVKEWHLTSRDAALSISKAALEAAGLVRIPNRDWLAAPGKVAVALVEMILQEKDSQR